MTHILLLLLTAGCFLFSVGQRLSKQPLQCRQTMTDSIVDLDSVPSSLSRKKQHGWHSPLTQTVWAYSTLNPLCDSVLFSHFVDSVAQSSPPVPAYFYSSLCSYSVTWTSPLSWISKDSCAKQPYLTTTRCVKLDEVAGWGGLWYRSATHDH